MGLCSIIRELLVGDNIASPPCIIVYNAEKKRNWEVCVGDILRIYTDRKTSLAIIETIDDYIWCYESAEEIIHKIIEAKLEV